MTEKELYDRCLLLLLFQAEHPGCEEYTTELLEILSLRPDLDNSNSMDALEEAYDLAKKLKKVKQPIIKAIATGEVS